MPFFTLPTGGLKGDNEPSVNFLATNDYNLGNGFPSIHIIARRFSTSYPTASMGRTIALNNYEVITINQVRTSAKSNIIVVR